MSLIDVGCAFGTPEFYALNERASLLLVDCVAEYGQWMQKTLERRQGGYAIAALGSCDGEVELDAGKRGTERRRVPVMTLDHLVEARKLQPPFGLRIGAKGSELEVLRGSTRILSETELLITGASMLPGTERSYSFLDLLQYLDRAGLEPHRVLTASADSLGLIRSFDVAFVRKSERASRC